VSDIIVGESNDLSLGQVALIEQLRTNPAVAAKVLLGVDLHWYQALALEDFFLNDKRFALLKWSRQLGKCAESKSIILIKLQNSLTIKKEIRLLTLEDLYDLINRNIDKNIKIEILTLNQETNKFEWTDNFSINYNGKKKCYKIKTSLGKELCLTDNHPLKKLKNWVNVKDLKIKDKIAVPRIINAFGDDLLNDNELIVLAYMIGDGCVRHYNQTETLQGIQYFMLSNMILKVIDEWQKCCKELFGNNIEFRCDRNVNYRMISPDKWKDVTNWLKKYKIWNELSYHKRVPAEIMGTSKRQIALFLSRLYATDGWACISDIKANENDSKNREHGQIGYCSVNKDLAKDIQNLLLRFGIIATLQTKPVEYTRKDGTKTIAYQLLIGDSRSILTFCNEIGIFGKEEAVNACRNLAITIDNNNNRDVIPIEIWEYIRKKVNEKLVVEKVKQKKWLKESGIRINRNEHVSLRKWDRDGLIRRKELTPLYPYAPQRDKVLKYAEFLNDNYLRSLANSDLYWDEVVSIEDIGEQDTYDLAVPGPDNGGKDGKYRNFICDDILVHNTFLESVMVGLQCILYPDEVGIFLAPSQRQSLNPMNNLLQCYNKSDIFKSLIVKKTKGHMVFKNRSEITSLPMGTGEKVLGQHATIAGIDEYARFTREYITTIILPMLNQKRANGMPNKLITLSTPLSKQNHFYNWYLTHKKYSSQPGSKYHLSEYNYQDCPSIDLDIIKMNYENSSWEQFARENLGEFTDNLDGFFPNDLIFSCVEEEDGEIKVQNVPMSDGRRYVLGVDPSNMVMQDRFAIYLYEIIESENGALGLMFANAWTFDKQTITYVEDLIRRIMIVFPILRCNIDSGGGGRQIAEHLMEPKKYRDEILGEDINWTGCKNEDVSDKTPQRGGTQVGIKIIPYSTEKKNRMFFNLKNLMSTGRFKLPKNNLQDKAYIESNLLKDELENITNKTLPNNLLTFDHPESVGDDRVNATALAVDAFWDVFYSQVQSTATLVRGVNSRAPSDMYSDFGKPRDFEFATRELNI
jgi:intein/homing endonuclease